MPPRRLSLKHCCRDRELLQAPGICHYYAGAAAALLRRRALPCHYCVMLATKKTIRRNSRRRRARATMPHATPPPRERCCCHGAARTGRWWLPGKVIVSARVTRKIYIKVVAITMPRHAAWRFLFTLRRLLFAVLRLACVRVKCFFMRAIFHMPLLCRHYHYCRCCSAHAPLAGVARCCFSPFPFSFSRHA